MASYFSSVIGAIIPTENRRRKSLKIKMTFGEGNTLIYLVNTAREANEDLVVRKERANQINIILVNQNGDRTALKAFPSGSRKNPYRGQSEIIPILGGSRQGFIDLVINNLIYLNSAVIEYNSITFPGKFAYLIVPGPAPLKYRELSNEELASKFS